MYSLQASQLYTAKIFLRGVLLYVVLCIQYEVSKKKKLLLGSIK